jgi:transcriptional regulator with XRE-family HTH domain
MDDPKLLPKPAKIAATHAYKELGFSDEKIAEMLGIDFKTVMRYKNKELDKEWEEFSSAIKKIYLEQDFELAQLAVKEIKKKIGKARFYELVGLLKTVRELQSPQQTQQQINIAAENMKVEFIENES